MAAAFLSGFLLYALILGFGKREKRTSKIVTNLAGGFCVSFFAVFFYRPGAWKRAGKYSGRFCDASGPGGFSGKCGPDFADGDYIGGGVRFLDALMVALGIAMGVGIMYFLYYNLTGGILL